MSPADLHVILVISNPAGYARRAYLCKRVMAQLKAAGVTVWLVEATFGGRDPEVAEPWNGRHLVLRNDDEIWLKENLQNIAERHLLTSDAEFIMAMDADFEFLRDDWAMATLRALQHWRVVQPFSHVVDLGPEAECISVTTGFAYDHNRGLITDTGAVYPNFHPGYAWAWRRSIWREMGGLLDRCVVGACDHHMALAMVEKVWLSIPDACQPSYKDYVAGWQHRANHVIEGDIGHIAGSIAHRFHGFKRNRRYAGRWDIVIETKFEPFKHLSADHLGMLHLAPGTAKLRDMMRRYFRSRHEDEGQVSWPTLSAGEW